MNSVTLGAVRQHERSEMDDRLPGTAERMAKADLRTAEYRARLALIVAEITDHWSLKEFAAALERATGRPHWDVRQLARWKSGQERPQFDAILAIESLRVPLMMRFAVLCGTAVEVTTQITVKASVA